MNIKILPYLRELDNSSIDIEASALVSVDGLVMAATLPLDIDADDVGAICAGAFLLGHQTSEKCSSGVLEQVLLRCTKNQIIMTRAGTETILAVIIKPYANIEYLFPRLKHSVEKMSTIIDMYNLPIAV